jgi:hypothetical protein
MIPINVVDRRRTLFMVACLFVLAIFHSSMAAASLTQSELDAQRAVWSSHNITDYDFIMQRQCLCTDDVVRPGIVAVRGDAILAVTDEETLAPLDPQYFFTIDGLFDLLQHGVDLNADDITANFHAQLGYPSFMRIDYDLGIADEEDIILARDLTIVPEPGFTLYGLLAAAAIGWFHRHWRRPQR